MMTPPTVLAFAASTSRRSINKALVTHAAHRVRTEFLPEAEIDLIDLNDFDCPIYSIDREEDDGIPEPVQRLLEHIGRADALLISVAEHNGYYTAAYKNFLDWMSRVQRKFFQDKPMVVLSTSNGAGGGGRALRAALDSAPHIGAEIVGSLSVPRYGENFDAERGILSDTELAEQLGTRLQDLARRLDAVVVTGT